MTSPDRVRRRRTGAFAAAILAIGGLTGCTLGESSTFAGRGQDSCEKTSSQIAALTRPISPVDRIGYALDRYTDVERLVSEISSDVSFPGGIRGATLRRGWLEPSRASLREGRVHLQALRVAVQSGDRAEQDRAFAESIRAGTVGVEPAALKANGLTSCVAVFAPSVAAPG